MPKAKPVKTNCTDEEFLQMVSEYIPKEEDAKETVPYEEAHLQNAKDMITKFTKLKEEADPKEEELIEYYDNVIAGYQKQIDQPQQKYSKEQIVSLIDNLKKCKDFDVLPVPVSYLKAKADVDEDARDELDRLKLMELQTKTKDPKQRLDNYKYYLLEKLDRRKLDKKLNTVV